MNVSMGVAVKQESGVFPVVWSVPAPPPPVWPPAWPKVSSLCIYLHTLEACSSHTDFKMVSSSDPKIKKENIFLETDASNTGEIKGAQMPTLVHYYQVLFRQCQRCCYLETVLLSKWEPPRERHFAPRQQRPASGAHPASHADPSCWALLSLDARSEFSTSINHRVPNGRLPFRMGPIAEGAAFEVVAEAALIAWIHSQLRSHCRCLLIVVIMANGGGLEYVMNFPSLSRLTSFADVHLLCEESVRRVWRGQMCFWMGGHSENMPDQAGSVHSAHIWHRGYSCTVALSSFFNLFIL